MPSLGIEVGLFEFQGLVLSFQLHYPAFLFLRTSMRSRHITAITFGHMFGV